MTRAEAAIALSAVATGAVGGVCLVFSAVVVPALGTVRGGGSAMVAINRISALSVHALFFGSTVLSAALAAATVPWWPEPEAVLLGSAGLLYGGGMFAVTILGNVPLNRMLVRDGDGAFAPTWLRWDHLRTAASFAASVLAALALAVLMPARQCRRCAGRCWSAVDEDERYAYAIEHVSHAKWRRSANLEYRRRRRARRLLSAPLQKQS